MSPRAGAPAPETPPPHSWRPTAWTRRTRRAEAPEAEPQVLPADWPTLTRPSDLGNTLNGRDTVESNEWREIARVGARIPIAYGRVKVSPPCVFLGTSDVAYHTALLKVAKIGVIWSEGPIHSIESWVTSKKSTVDALGTISQAGAGIPGCGALAGVAHSLVETAILAPEYPTAIIKGRKLFDPRLGAWTTGDYPPDAYCQYNRSGHNVSANPALIAADILTNTQYGLAVNPAFVDWASVAAAADYCDETVDGEARWACHLYVREERSLWEWMETVLAHFGGFWRESLGSWTLDYHRALSTPDLYVTEDNIAKSVIPRVSEAAGAGIADIPNRITVEWTDPTTWLTRSVSVQSAEVDAGAAVREGDPYKLHGFQSEKAAQRAATRILALVSGLRNIEVTLMPSAIGIGLGALIDVTLPSLGLTHSRWVVTNLLSNPDGTISVTAREHDTSAYTTTTSGDTLPGTGFFDTPPALTGFSDLLSADSDTVTSANTTTKTSYLGYKWVAPTFAFAKQVRIRYYAGLDDTKTWDDAALIERIVPFNGDANIDAGIGYVGVSLRPVVEGTESTTYDTFGNIVGADANGGGFFALARLESLAGVLGPASSALLSVYMSTSTGTGPEIVRTPTLTPLTTNAIPKARNGNELIDSKLVDTGTDILYGGVSLLGGGGKVLRAQEYTSGTTNWTAPTGVTEVWVTGCAGGGGGGRGGGASSGSGGGGGGGGGSSVFRKRLTVTPGNTYSVVVGGGGAGATNSANPGSTGGATSFGALLTLGGGGGGVSTQTASGGGGGGNPGNSGGGQPGSRGESYVGTYETAPLPGRGGLSFPGGWGCGGDGAGNTNGESGQGGYLLIEWNE